MRLSEFKIDRPKASDTMGITRDKMPQVKQDDYQEYKDYLKITCEFHSWFIIEPRE